MIMNKGRRQVTQVCSLHHTVYLSAHAPWNNFNDGSFLQRGDTAKTTHPGNIHHAQFRRIRFATEHNGRPVLATGVVMAHFGDIFQCLQPTAPNGDEALTLLPLSEKDPRLEASVNRLEV